MWLCLAKRFNAKPNRPTALLNCLDELATWPCSTFWVESWSTIPTSQVWSSARRAWLWATKAFAGASFARGMDYGRSGHHVEFNHHQWFWCSNSHQKIGGFQKPVPGKFSFLCPKSPQLEEGYHASSQPTLKPRVTLSYSINHVGEQGAWFRMLCTWHCQGIYRNNICY